MRFIPQGSRLTLTFVRRYTVEYCSLNTPHSELTQKIVQVTKPNDATSDDEIDLPKNRKENHAFYIKQHLDDWISKQDAFPESNHDFSVFPKLHKNPIRSNIPEMPEEMKNLKFKEMDDTDKKMALDYMREITRFSYPKKERYIQSTVKPIYQKYRSLPEIRDEYLYFNTKKYNGTNVNKLMKSGRYDKSLVAYSSLIDMTSIIKNSRNSVSSLRSITRKLSENNIPITNELVYKLYYALPIDSARFLLTELNKIPSVSVSNILFDAEVLRIKSYDEVKDKLLSSEIEFSYASFIQLVKWMVKEGRVNEGMNFLHSLILLHRVEIPVMLCKYAVDMILSHEQCLGIPAALALQKITGCSLKAYTTNRLSKMLLASKITTREVVILYKLIFNVSKWQVGKFKSELYDLLKQNEQNDLIDLVERPINTPEFLELQRLFETVYVTSSATFKPGFGNQLEPIYTLFPSYKKYAIMCTEIDEYIRDEEWERAWIEKIEPFSKLNPPLFIKLCRYLGSKLATNEGYSNKVIPFVEYVQTKYGINIEYIVYFDYLTELLSFTQGEDITTLSKEMKLTKLLAYKLNMTSRSVVNAYIERYPHFEDVCEYVENYKNAEQLERDWRAHVIEVSWPSDISPPPLDRE